MAIYWLSTLDPDEKGYFEVDWTDEMDAAGDTITGTPSFTFIDSSVYGLRASGVSIITGSKKVGLYIDNEDAATNRTDVLANSPYLITHEISTAAGQTLQRVIGLVVTERGSELTVETGSSSASGDSYATIEAADQYHVNRGNTDWTGTDAEKARMLRRGTQYLDNRYLGRWKGTKATSGQALQWPRDSMTDEDGNGIDSDAIPQKIIDACCEAARMVPYTQKVSNPQNLKRVKAGSVEVEYATEAPQREILDLVDELVRPFVNAAGRIVRA
jgi:hypothetical protein